MSCETKQEQASLLIDGELPEPNQIALFRHLEECSECRSFFDSMVRFRKAARIDREEVLLSADEVLPRNVPSFGGPRPAVARRWFGILESRWRLPAPVAVALAAILVAGGVLLGARMANVTEAGGSDSDQARVISPTVVVVCGLPPVDVVGTGPVR